ncbi:MAG: transposase [Planctomycetaceae bacterium]|nr:transposase [Planctomycetaceae bacterium]
MHADAHGGCDGIYAGGAVCEVACWVHARRKSYDAQDSDGRRTVSRLPSPGCGSPRRLWSAEQTHMTALSRPSLCIRSPFFLDGGTGGSRGTRNFCPYNPDSRVFYHGGWPG